MTTHSLLNCVCLLDVRALLYVVAQSAGSVCGAAILKGVLPSVELSNTIPGPGVAIWSVFIIELIITFVLVLTVFATCDSLRPGIGGSGPLAAGLAVSMCNLWAVRSRFHLRLLQLVVMNNPDNKREYSVSQSMRSASTLVRYDTIGLEQFAVD